MPAIPTGGVTPQSRKVMNIAHILTQNARRFRDHDGLIWGEQQWTWAEIDRRVSAMSVALKRAGIVKGDRVLVHSKNCNQMFESMFACFRLGAVWVPTNYRSMPDDVLSLAQACAPKAFLCHAEASMHAKLIGQKLPGLRLSAYFGERGIYGEDMEALIAAEAGRDMKNADVDYDDPCWFFFTSGTTGKPKAAVLTHGQMAFVITNHLCDLTPATTEADASLVVAPLSHGAGIHQLMQAAKGARSVLLASDRLDCDLAWKTVEQERITNIFTVPTILKLLSEHPAVDQNDHRSLRYVIYAGAPMYREDQKRALDKLGKVLVQYFGLGEVTGNICVLPRELHRTEDDEAAKIGTCGYERTGMQVSIQDETGNELPPNETGEICVIGPAVFAGYYNNPDANADAFRDGWFRTGDLGYMDEEGFVYITGRASDMYISGGSNIYPREIEEKILMHAAIAEAAVVGVPDRDWGEVGYAICVRRGGEAMTEDALLAFLSDRVARYKLPKRVLFWDALPKSGYGKISKKIILDELEQRGLLPDLKQAKERAR